MELELVYDDKSAIPESVMALYTEKDGKYHLTGVKGMKTQADIDRVMESLRKERTDHAAAKEALKPWADLKPDEVRAQLDRIKELEAAAGGKLDENKLNEIVEGRLAQKTGPLQRQLETLTGEKTTLAQQVEQLKGEIENRNRSEEVRAIATESKVHATAIADIELAASVMLERDETGKLVTKNGIPGVTPGLDVKGFMKEMQKLRPHWWPESEGGGARGGGGGGGFGGSNPWSAESWNLTEQGRVVREQGMDTATRMAKAAGTSIGGARPASKK